MQQTPIRERQAMLPQSMSFSKEFRIQVSQQDKYQNKVCPKLVKEPTIWNMNLDVTNLQTSRHHSCHYEKFSWNISLYIMNQNVLNCLLFLCTLPMPISDIKSQVSLSWSFWSPLLFQIVSSKQKQLSPFENQVMNTLPDTRGEQVKS